VEALVVVSITALVALLGFPQLRRGLDGMARRETAANVVERLREARGEAMRSDRAVAFALASDHQGYGVVGEAQARTAPGVTIRVTGDAAGRLIFYGDGSSSGGVVRIDGGGREMVITVSPLASVASVDRG
jgi:type II secretory pathway pseudopilin PulG